MPKTMFAHPLDGFFTAGNYCSDAKKNPDFIIRSLKELSIVVLKPYDAQDIQFAHCLKSVLGLVVPDAKRAYVAGTRTIISPEDNHYLVTTEGEARDVLAGRLNYALGDYAGVFEYSAAYAVLRIDGYHFYDILKSMTACPEHLMRYDNYCSFIDFDDCQIIVHQKSEDVMFLYLPRAFAPDIYRNIARSCLKFGVRLI